MDKEPINEKAENSIKSLSNGFIPEFKGKKVIIRLVSGGQPVTGIIEEYSPYELLLQTTKGKIVVFKHAIATIEPLYEQKGLQADRGGFKADDKTFSAR